MKTIKFADGKTFPVEMHRARIVSKMSLITPRERLQAITEAGFNSFLLKNRSVFLDMLTDSGVNAMSDLQLAAMMKADDSYAGSETFYRVEDALQQLFNMKFTLPAHQGRACEHIIAKTLVQPGNIVAMNYHFTTTKAHILLQGGHVVECYQKEAMNLNSDHPFKGNMDLGQLIKLIEDQKENIAFVRMEAGTNLIGGQPFSLENLETVSMLCRQHQLKLILDASLLSDNLYFMVAREQQCKAMDLNQLTLKIAELVDIIYFSARKLGAAKGGIIVTNDEDLYKQMRPLVPIYEGFLTYGGMSVREMEALATGLYETLDIDNISQGPLFIEAMVEELKAKAIPVVTPAGGLGCHINAKEFLAHLNPEVFPAAALVSAIYLVSGVRGMERGTMSEERNPDGSEHVAEVELVRLALPRRVFSLSHILYTVDRINWLFKHRELIGGLEWIEEPDILRFFYGRLQPIGNWPEKLIETFERDFPDSL